MKLVIALLACVIIFYLSALKWRRSVKVVFLLLVLEGALRKWVLPQASEMIYFLKDVVLMGAYFNFYGLSAPKEKLPKQGKIVNILIFIAIGWCVFQIFNPSLGSPLVGIFGLRGYLLYLPLIWMIPYMFESEDELYEFLRSHLLLTIPVGIIGIVQFFSPHTSFINAYSNTEAQAVVTFGVNSAVRITGTFSYIGGYSIYLIVCFGLLIIMLSAKQSRAWQLINLVELFLVSVNSFMTGSRTTIFAEALFLAGYLLAKGLTKPTSALRLMQRLTLPVIIISIASFIWFQSAIDAFWMRTTSSNDVSNRIAYSFIEPIEFMKFKELDGYGTGAAHQATPIFRQALDLPSGEKIPTYHEGEMGKIILELGPIGFIFWYVLRVGLILALLYSFGKLKRPFLRELAIAAALIQLVQINGFLVFHHTFSVYYWFLSSFIFLLPRLEQIENWQREFQLWQEDALSSYFPDSPYR
ncbi:MAG: hypothetical protein AB1589_01110 [Cyanobacteriota bacterium]